MKSLTIIAAVFVALATPGAASEAPATRKAVRIIDMSVDSPHQVLDVNKAGSTVASSDEKGRRGSEKARTQ